MQGSEQQQLHTPGHGGVVEGEGPGVLTWRRVAESLQQHKGCRGLFGDTNYFLRPAQRQKLADIYRQQVIELSGSTHFFWEALTNTQGLGRRQPWVSVIISFALHILLAAFLATRPDWNNISTSARADNSSSCTRRWFTSP